MRKRELERRLREIADDMNDPEAAHQYADRLLLLYIGDEDVRKAFEAITKGYQSDELH